VETRPCEVIIAAEFLDMRSRLDPSGLTSCKFMYRDPSEFWEVNMVIAVGHSKSSRAVSDGVGGPARDAHTFPNYFHIEMHTRNGKQMKTSSSQFVNP
jgi:hypothetical protein